MEASFTFPGPRIGTQTGVVSPGWFPVHKTSSSASGSKHGEAVRVEWERVPPCVARTRS